MDDTDVRKQPIAADGSFHRQTSKFRDIIEKGGKYEPERAVTTASPRMTTAGWPFAVVDKFPGSEVDPLYNSETVTDLYRRADPTYPGKFTVPVLWDKKTQTIVNNESSEIIRIFNSAFNELLPPEYAKIDLYPEELRKEVDKVNEWVYSDINNGVYRVGFATTQRAYEDAVYPLFAALDRAEEKLRGKEFLVGNRLTEADVRLWVTIIRFDAAYHTQFKCNIKDTVAF
ncbi:S-glutathionyl-(chloro)hydroquinone reductase [Paramarasmius palmivorus]|uniref:S-glutathionyl-(Chloro)hydroquinone reductase n=1 Tax=Paramarasmius palmivorus TaxID=297713 RepID=A0AAW0D8I2_9AGAR